MHRDRGQTEQRLIEAVGQIIVADGYNQVKINRVATQAGVNKILIYRYFGGLPGLIQAYVQQIRPITVELPFDADRLKTIPLEEALSVCCEYLLAEFRLLRQNVEEQEFLKAKLRQQDIPDNSMLTDRNKRLQHIISLIGSRLGTPDGPVYANFMYSALTMLTLLSRQGQHHLGFDLSSDESWQQVETVVRHLFREMVHLYSSQQDNTRPVDGSGEEPA